MNEITKYLEKIANKTNLTYEEAMRSMQIIKLGGATPAQISAFIMGLSTKGICAEEINGISHLLQKKFKENSDLSHLQDYLLISNADNVNLSVDIFAVSLILSCAEYRTLSFFEGMNLSSNFLNEIFIKYHPSVDFVTECLNKINIGIIILDQYNLFSKDLIFVKKEIGIRSFFDLIKPVLCRFNNKICQIIKLPSKDYFDLYTNILSPINEARIWLVYNDDQNSLFSIDQTNYIVELNNDQILKFEINTKDFLQNRLERFNTCNDFDSIKFSMLFNNCDIRQKEYIILNAAICISIIDKNINIAPAIDIVCSIISNGVAKSLIAKLSELTNLV